MGDEHPSQHAKVDKGHQGGGPNQGKDRPSSMGQGNQGRKKGKHPKDDNQSSSHAKMDKGNRGGPQQSNQDPQVSQKGGTPKGHDRHSKGKGKPSMGSPVASDSETHQMDTRGKPDKGKPKSKGKQKNTFADSSKQEDSSVQSSSHSKEKGKPSKQNRNFARGPSGQGGQGTGAIRSHTRGEHSSLQG